MRRLKRIFWKQKPHWAIVLLLCTVAGPTVAGAQTQFLGSEFRVNNPDSTDSFPNVDSNAAGTSVVVWHCVQPSVGSEICAQRVSLTGRLAGEEFIVNQASSGTQQFADVAVDDAGNFFVVWESNGGEDGSGFTVLGRLFKPNGVALGDQQVLNAFSSGSQRAPAVAWRPGHGWVVAWDTTHAGGNQIFARRFASNGSPQGSEVLISTNPPMINIGAGNRNASVDAAADGDYVIAWQGLRVFEIFGGSEVFARRFNANGSPKTATFRIVTNAEFQKNDPTVSVNASGAFVIVFSRGDSSIVARRYNSNGSPQGAEFKISQGPVQITTAGVAMADDGRFVATWTSALGEFISGTFSVLQRVYKANGAPAENEQLVAERGQRPFVALDAAGDALVVYHANGPDAFARLSQTKSECPSIDTAACAANGRFKVEVAWRSNNGDVGVGIGDLLTDETAIFWFFQPANIELALKNLDACDFTSTFWVFAAGATDVEVDLSVTDTEFGIVRRWFDPLNSPFVTIRNTQAFSCDGSRSVTEHPEAGTEELATFELSTNLVPETDAVDLIASSSAMASCSPSSTALCLNQGRFRVTATYQANGQTGTGLAIPLTADSGYFWFFAPGNVEILAKVLDGCGFNQRFWVLGAGLTDLAVNVEVLDTATGQRKVYSGQAGSGFPAVIDTAAFATCM